MAPKIPTKIACSSTVMLEHELSEVRAGLELTETEDTWNKICNALLRLNALAVGSSADYPTQLIAACKGLVRPIINSLNTERSRLSGAATDVLATLATNLKRSFEGLIPLFVPTLLSLASRSNKIFIARAKNCLMTIVENCQSPVILPLLRHAVSDKSVTLRITATDLVMACLNVFNPPDLEAPNRVDDIETVIRATARDASADVRKSSRKVFEAYKILFPSRVDSFVAPLTPVMRKYLDIKAAPAAQRKPLLLSSSTSAPSLPLSIQAADPMTRSHPSTQSHAKSSSTSSTAFTRVGKPDRKAKPPKNETNKETSSMPPPAPPRIPTSGPVRPPPSMRQAVAAASAAPSRPLLVRHALAKLDTASTLDLTRSQPASHGGAQRPPKPLTPPATSSSPSLDAEQPAPNPLEVDETVKVRSKGAAKRVPKPEPVPIPSAPVPEQKQAESLKSNVKGREKAPFASSTSSTASMRETATEPGNIYARSRPPSRLASSTRSKAGEEAEGEKDNTRPSSRMGGEFRPRSRTDVEHNKLDKAEPVRPASRTGQFRPRPAAKTEDKAHKRTDSKDKDAVPQPPAGAEREVPVFSRPQSRAERKTQTNSEAREETKEVRPTKEATGQRLVEQPHQHVQPAHHLPETQTETHPKLQMDAPIRRVKSKRKVEERSDENRPSLEDPSLERKESRKAKETKETKEKRSTRDKPEKKKKRKVEATEMGHKEKQSGSEELQSSSSTKNETKSMGDIEGVKGHDVPSLAPNERGHHEAVPESHLNGESPNMNVHPAPADLHADQTHHPESSENTEVNCDGDMAHATQEAPHARESIPPSENVDIAEEPIAEMKTPQRPTKPTARRHGRHGVRPLVIRKASLAGQTESERQEPDANSDSEYDYEQENAYITAADIPLPGTPPSSNCWIPPPREFETPAPLRQATAALKYRVAKTPISKLLMSIERGFEFDCSMIGEEDEIEEEDVREQEDGAVVGMKALSDLSCALENIDAGIAKKEEVQEEEVDFGGPQCFVDMRRRRHKIGGKGGKQEERVPFTPRVENH